MHIFYFYFPPIILYIEFNPLKFTIFYLIHKLLFYHFKFSSNIEKLVFCFHHFHLIAYYIIICIIAIKFKIIYSLVQIKLIYFQLRLVYAINLYIFEFRYLK